jgi:uncharacterized phage protein gp47/JayE
MIVVDYTQLSDEAIQLQLTVLQQRIAEALPDSDTRRGPLHDLLLLPQAIIEAGRREEIDKYLSARSLRDIQLNPTLADQDTVDANLSNWGLSRIAGEKATGQVAIVLSRAISVTISRGAVFTANGHRFLAVSPFVSKSSQALVNSVTDRVMTQIGDNQFAFVIDVEAEDIGSGFMLRKDTLVTPSSKPTSFVMAYALSDFQGGLDAETNDELLSRLADGMACQTTSNRGTMRSLLRHDPRFYTVIRSSIVGLGFPEMVRDRHGLLPVSQGGRADWYVRTQDRLHRVAVRKTATLVETLDDGFGIWQFTVGQTDLAGFYEIQKISPVGTELGASGLPIVSDIRSVDTTWLSYPPDVPTAIEGVYSSVQTAIIRFKDETRLTNDLVIGDTAQYDMEVVGMPQIGDLQQMVSATEVNHYGGDVLIKAPVPCFVSVTVNVVKRATDAALDEDAIRTAIVAAVHATGFTGVLYASRLILAAIQLLPAGAGLGTVIMSGRLRSPDGSSTSLRDRSELRVPDRPDTMISARTVQFFADPADVFINVTNDLPVDV